MKYKNSLLRLIGFLLFSVAVITSCSKQENAPVYDHYVSKTLAMSYTQTYISSMLTTVSATIPEISTLKPLVKSDMKIYRVVYKTNINGNEINASGLVCYPSTSGEYPVISFQNGTNTVNAFAPSEYVLNSSFQLMEIVASMGYIIVIPDYPGFGESVTTTHPYLVKEPTVRSIVDMLYAVKELTPAEIPGITIKNAYYLMGYSQGGWATLATHKALELDYAADFNLAGSACGAGPYNISLLFESMVNVTTYPMPVYLGYILNAYKAYNQFTNPVSDIFKEPFASKLGSLYTGVLGFDAINSQLTTSIPGLLTSDFITGYAASAKYSTVRDALRSNSISAWNTKKPLLLIHGGGDTQVNPITTENMYSTMLQAGTSSTLITKVIVPNVDHSDGVVPCMLQAIKFLQNLNNSK
jgi:pimeloyl-ACP methyl ester carboxylesterase